MRFFHSFKPPTKRLYISIAVALIFGCLFGWSNKAYSPAHIGRYAIPIPRLIPVTRIFNNPSSAPNNTKTGSNSSVLGQSETATGNSTTPITFNHSNIITTYFWVGEKASGDNGGIANVESAWDSAWATHFGGEDAPSPRNGYEPAGFKPKENPFYFALPYNDANSQGKRKASASNCPLASQKSAYSWCKNGWIAIRHNGKTAFAQWEDVGPFEEDDAGYVFGLAAPRNTRDAKAGLDVSPAVKDYLGLGDVDKADWVFVSSGNVPSGPWKSIITTTPGYEF